MSTNKFIFQVIFFSSFLRSKVEDTRVCGFLNKERVSSLCCSGENKCSLIKTIPDTLSISF